MDKKYIDNKIIITDETGKEIEMEIMFTFSKEDNNYVVYFDPSKGDEEELTVYADRYDEKGNLYAIETDEEYAMIEEVINAYSEEQNDSEDETNK